MPMKYPKKQIGIKQEFKKIVLKQCQQNIITNQ